MKKKIIIVLIILILIASLVLYARYIGNSGLIVKEYKINADIEDSYDGLKIVHFSDIHYGRIITDKRIDNIIDTINLLKPDIVVWTGDLIDSDANLDNETLNNLSKKLSNINAKLNKYAILGDDDYSYNENTVKTILKNSNFIILENKFDIIYNENNDRIFIGGIDTTDIENSNSIFNEMSDIKYKIVIMHEPDYIDSILNNNIDLVLAGHSHNGQIRLPIIGGLFKPINAKKYYDNYYRINNTDLYISSGIGVSKMNYRLFNKPSINFYRINKK